MTVPKSKRRISSMEYIENALKLAREMLSLKKRMPKRYRYDVGSSLFDHAAEAVYHLQAANRIRVGSQEDYERRKGHLDDAEGHIDHVATMLSIWYVDQLLEPSLKDPNDNVYDGYTERIDRERELIGGVKRKDRTEWAKVRDSRGRGRGQG